MRTHNIPLRKEYRKDIPIMPPGQALLTSSNYPCLEHFFHGSEGGRAIEVLL